MLILSNSEVRAAERAAFSFISELDMIENAGRAFSRLLEKYLTPEGKALFLCGPGKNGADGFAAASALLSRGFQAVCVVLSKSLSAECTVKKNAFQAAGGEVVSLHIREDVESILLYSGFSAVGDALFGSGLSREITGLYAETVDILNKSGLPVVSADIPSGVSSDSGRILGRGVRAAETAAFTALRPGHILWPGNEYCGRITLCSAGFEAQGAVFAPDAGLVQKVLPPRQKESHKGTYGKAVLLCGSKGYAGAAFFAAQAAVRSGAGLVYLLVPEEIYDVAASKVNEPVVVPLETGGDGFTEAALKQILRYAEGADAVLAGCGLGQSPGAEAAVASLAAMEKPLILDADGINIISRHRDLLAARTCPAVLTPHDGELARFCKEKIPTGYGERLAFARRFAEEHGVTLLMKGYRTVTAGSGAAFVNMSGNPGMAKGGSGDVLAGVLSAFAAQGNGTATEQAAAAAFVHGLSGDAARAEFGEVGMTPTDMLEKLPLTIEKLRNA